MSRLVAALLLSLTSAAEAQDLRGVVLDSATRRPVVGAVLQLLDTTARSLGRTITNERGEYRVPLLAGTTRLRFQRLGYRPRELSVSSQDGMRLDVSMLPLPRLLEPVVARANPLCPRRPDEHIAFALWQQARAGLLSTVVAREANPAQIKVLVYRHLLVGAAAGATPLRVRADSGAWTTAFAASFPATEFVATGFVSVDARGRRIFHGPDAEVLLEEAFQAAYCFSIASADPLRRNQVGLRFVPGTSDPRRMDIDGTLWVDTVARALRDIEFRYLGSDKVVTEQYRPGGHVGFREMPNGIGLVDRWSIRMLTQMAEALQGASLRDRTPGQWGETDPLKGRHYFITEGGAEIARADWPDGTHWRASLGRVRLTVVDQGGRPIPGVGILLDSTDYSAVSDSIGVAEISELLPGLYRATIVDSTLALVGLRLNATTDFVAARDSTLEVKLVARTEGDFVRQICGRDQLASPTRQFLVVVRVLTESETALKGARWRLGDKRGTTGADGLLYACGVRREEVDQVELQLWHDNSSFSADNPKRIPVMLQSLVVRQVELPVKP